jgi:predicted RNA-binding protein with RPS1 domain
MRIVTGRVVDGKIVVEGEGLEEGAFVTVVAQDEGEFFHISDADKAFLRESLAEIRRGESVTASEMFDELRRLP